MATLAQSRPIAPASQPAWLWELLIRELSPYPTRAATVARMVISAVVVAFLIMTLHIPGAALSAYYTLIIPRENPQTALRSSLITLASCAAGTVYVLVGAMLFLDSPFVHFLWVMATLFLAFYVLHVVKIYSGATGFGFVATIGISIWDRQVRPEMNVSATLFTLLAIAIGCGVTVAVEYIFHSWQPGDHVISGVTERLRVVSSFLSSLAEEQPIPLGTQRKLFQYEMIGTGQLRQILQRGNYPQVFRVQLGTVVALSGRLIDLATAVNESRLRGAAGDEDRLRALVNRLDRMRSELLAGETPELFRLEDLALSSVRIPLLPELEQTAALISQAFAGVEEPGQRLPKSGHARTSFFVEDMFTNPEHVKFALRGVLSAGLCYIVYTGLNWPGINTALATCIVTAFSNVGTSRQKQLLRVTGAIIGGLLFGIGSQAFLLPHMDSIVQFMFLFAAVTAIAAWIGTSSPRISYIGLQIALAYDLINLNEFTVNTSVTAARDRVFGILLGLAAMWLIFDRLWSTPAVEGMLDLFVRNMRLIAHFPSLSRVPQESELSALRDKIYGQFAEVRALSDAVLFEFGPNRPRNLLFRQRVRMWQPELRSLFILQLALRHRFFLNPGLQSPEEASSAQQEAASLLERLATYLDQLKANETVSPLPALGSEHVVEETTVDRKADRSGAQAAGTIAALAHSLRSVVHFLYEDIRRDTALLR